MKKTMLKTDPRIVINGNHFIATEIIKKEINNNNPKGTSSFSFSQEILEFDPSSYPLICLLKRLPSHPFTMGEVVNPKFVWSEDNSGVENFLQIFKTEFSSTSDMREKGIEHLVDIDKAFWHGENKTGVRKTKGILSFLKNSKRIRELKYNSYSVKEFNDFLREGFIYGDSTKVLFMDENSFEYLINLYGHKEKIGGVESQNIKNTWGIKDVKKIVTIFGIINIIKEPSLDKMMCLIDMSCLKYTYFKNRDTFVRTHLQKGMFQDVDPLNKEEEKKLLIMMKNLPHKHMFLTECGLQFTRPDNHLAVGFI